MPEIPFQMKKMKNNLHPKCLQDEYGNSSGLICIKLQQRTAFNSHFNTPEVRLLPSKIASVPIVGFSCFTKNLWLKITQDRDPSCICVKNVFLVQVQNMPTGSPGLQFWGTPQPFHGEEKRENAGFFPRSA